MIVASQAYFSIFEKYFAVSIGFVGNILLKPVVETRFQMI